MALSPSDQITAILFTEAEAQARFARVAESLLAWSPRLRSPQFESIGVADLAHLFRLYDEHFFNNNLSALIAQAKVPPVEFQLSNRMTRAAGRTVQRRTRRRSGAQIIEQVDYCISISALLLFQTFRSEVTANSPVRSIEVAGVVCTNRLEALLRIFEHELLHLAEFLMDGRSSCSQAPFRRLSRAIFGHAASVHTLITPVESAALVHALAPGDRVRFEHAGVNRVGIIQRITRRASVLVPDRSGQMHSDGVRYLRFLVPLDQLRKV